MNLSPFATLRASLYPLPLVISEGKGENMRGDFVPSRGALPYFGIGKLYGERQ